MTAIRNPRLVFASIPQGYPVPGETTKYDDTFSIDPENCELAGGFLTKTLYLSLDPYMRGRMRDEKIKSFVPAFPLGEPLMNSGIAVVVRSETPTFKAGDHVYGHLPFEHYTVHSAEAAKSMRVLKNEEGLPLTVYLGVAGMPGQTGYMGMKAIAEAKEGESIFVSTGAGPVGQVVCQLCKIWGLRVIASAGSDDKVKFMKDVLKVDRAFNYKTSSVAEELEKFGGIDIYWDNVGGPTLEAAIAAMNVHGRVIICGMASEYNDEESYGVKGLKKLIYSRIKMQGFVVGEFRAQYDEEFYSTVPKMIKEGKIQYCEDIIDGLTKGGEGLLRIMKGENMGKVVIKVQDE